MESSKFPVRDVGKSESTAVASPARRRLLGRVALTPLLLLGGAMAARAAKPAACVDLNSLSPSDASLRQALGFKLQTLDPQRHCSVCAFFTATAGGCGTCMLLSGGAVSANSVCDSWAAKS